MRKNAWLLTIAPLLLVLSACSGPEEQAVRHRVIAELIERNHVPENHIQVQHVQFKNRQTAVVQAKVLGNGGRADSWQIVRCELIREQGHWSIRDLAPYEGTSK